MELALREQIIRELVARFQHTTRLQALLRLAGIPFTPPLPPAEQYFPELLDRLSGIGDSAVFEFLEDAAKAAGGGFEARHSIFDDSSAGWDISEMRTTMIRVPFGIDRVDAEAAATASPAPAAAPSTPGTLPESPVVVVGGGPVLEAPVDRSTADGLDPELVTSQPVIEIHLPDPLLAGDASVEVSPFAEPVPLPVELPVVVDVPAPPSPWLEMPVAVIQSSDAVPASQPSSDPGMEAVLEADRSSPLYWEKEGIATPDSSSNSGISAALELPAHHVAPETQENTEWAPVPLSILILPGPGPATMEAAPAAPSPVTPSPAPISHPPAPPAPLPLSVRWRNAASAEWEQDLPADPDRAPVPVANPMAELETASSEVGASEVPAPASKKREKASPRGQLSFEDSNELPVASRRAGNPSDGAGQKRTAAVGGEKALKGMPVSTLELDLRSEGSPVSTSIPPLPPPQLMGISSNRTWEQDLPADVPEGRSARRTATGDVSRQDTPARALYLHEARFIDWEPPEGCAGSLRLIGDGFQSGLEVELSGLPGTLLAERVRERDVTLLVPASAGSDILNRSLRIRLGEQASAWVRVERGVMQDAGTAWPILRKGAAYVCAGRYLLHQENQPRELKQGAQLSLTPVTNREMFRFVKETGYRPEYAEDFLLHLAGEVPEDIADQPVTYVNGYDARAYAEWVGGFLPSAELWERAAVGLGAIAYPWGDTFQSSRLNSREARHGGPTSVHLHPTGAGPFGHLELAGNVWEWTDSPGSGEFHLLIKGGCWANDRNNVSPSVRNQCRIELRNHYTGFRVAWTLPSDWSS